MSTTRYKKRLTRRIEWAVVAMCLLVATIFSFGSVYSINYIESETAQLNLGHTLDVLIYQHLHHLPINIGGATHFYDGGHSGTGLPGWWSGAKEGFNRLSHAGSEWYALSQSEAGHRYVLVQRSDALAWRQQHIYLAIFICWVVCAVAGVLIGRWLVRMAIHPLIRLTDDIRRIQYSEQPTALAASYSDDEVGQLAAAFDRATQEVLMLLAREREFTGGVSHELRSPLMVIKGACELLQSAGLSSRQERVVKRIATASAQMDALVSAFLVLARGRHVPDQSLKWGRLDALVSEVIEQLESQTDIPQGVITITHESQLDHYVPVTLALIVLSNLLRNAIAYSKGAPVEVRLFDGGVEIKDQAPLMGNEVFSQMLTPLTRGRAAHQHEGLGLGLAIVKRICDFMEWRLEYQVVENHNCILVIINQENS